MAKRRKQTKGAKKGPKSAAAGRLASPLVDKQCFYDGNSRGARDGTRTRDIQLGNPARFTLKTHNPTPGRPDWLSNSPNSGALCVSADRCLRWSNSAGVDSGGRGISRQRLRG